MEDLHRSILLGHQQNGAEHLHQGEFEKIFDNPDLAALFHLSPSIDYSTTIRTATIELISKEKQSELLQAAIAALQAYTQTNFTGPRLEFNPVGVLISSDAHDLLVETLSRNGENSFRLQSHPELLVFAEAVLSELVKCDELGSFSKWWYARALVIHQSTLSDDSAELYELITLNLTEDTLKGVLTGDVSPALAKQITIRFHCEVARAHLLYGHEGAAEAPLDIAQKLSQLKYVLTGMKGKRTKFQVKEASLLVMVAKSAEDKAGTSEEKPSAVELNSDLMLEQPTYDKSTSTVPEELRDVDPNDQPALQDIDTAIILLRVAKIRQSNPHKHVLIQEELTAMVDRIIHTPIGTVNWCLFSRALWVRSLLEADSVKTAERGTLQILSLVEELGQAKANYVPQEQDERGDVLSRLMYIHELLPLPRWKLDVELAERFMAFGALKSALEVYERLELFSEVALCYAAVGEEKKGLDVLDQWLADRPNDARAWAIKGDITLDPQYWEKSWSISKFPAAKRSLGRYYFNPPRTAGIARDLSAAIRHLNDSLQVNPLNHGAWFLYGCAGLETEQWELAAEAFTRCVAIEDDDPKSWSNMATALLRLGKKPEAFSALKHAVKSASDLKDWRIWTNYITVAADLGEWSEVVRGMKQIMEIRGDKEGEIAVDLDMLERVVQVLVNTEFSPSSLSHLQRSTIDLVTNQVPQFITSDPRLWKLVGKVSVWLKRPWAALDCYEKAYRIITQHVEVDEAHWNEAVDLCGELVDAYINFGPQEGRIEGSVVCSDWKFKAKTAVRSLIGKGKTMWQDTPGWDRLQDIKQEANDA